VQMKNSTWKTHSKSGWQKAQPNWRVSSLYSVENYRVEKYWIGRRAKKNGRCKKTERESVLFEHWKTLV
jgi:hypothetical protein